MAQAIPIATALILGPVLGLSWPIQLIGFVAASYIAGLLTPDPEKRPTGSKLSINTQTSEAFLKLCYGVNRIGGNDAFVESDGKYLWIVQTFAEGECDNIATDADGDLIYFNGRRLQDYGLGEDEDYDINDFVSYSFHNGTNSQTVDTNLNSEISKWTDTLINTCYIVWRLTYDTKVFSSRPLREIVLKGKKLYNPITEVTEYSSNPILEIVDFYSNSRYGLNESINDFDLSCLEDAIDYCNTKNWTCNAAFGYNENVRTIIDKLLASCRCKIILHNGVYYIKYTDLLQESSVMTVTDAHIVTDENGKTLAKLSQPSIFDKPQCLKVLYTDNDNEFIQNQLLIGEAFGNVEELDLVQCFKDQAYELGLYHFERRNYCLSLQISLRDDAVKLLVHDVVTLTCTALGITSQLMRVIETNYNVETGLNIINLIYENVDLYDLDYNILTDVIYECTLPNPKALPPQVVDVSFNETIYNIKDRTYVRLRIAWSALESYPYVDRTEVWICRPNTDPDNYYHLGTANDYIYLDPTEENEVIYFKFLPISIWGVKLTLEQASIYTYKVYGKLDIVPENVLHFNVLVSGDTIHLTWTQSTDKDIVGYEIRYGEIWEHSLFVLLVQATSKVLTGWRPGEHTLLIKAKNALNLYSDTEGSATFKIFGPPGYTEYENEIEDYEIEGSHVGTEYANDPTYGKVLRVDRTYLSDPSYISQLIDNSSSELGNISGNHHEKAQSFTLNENSTIVSAKIKFGANSGSPIGGVTARIETLDIDGMPSGILAHTNLTKTDTPSESAWHTFEFDTPATISAGSYAIVLLIPEQSENVYRTVRFNGNVYFYGDKFARIASWGYWVIYKDIFDLTFELAFYTSFELISQLLDSGQRELGNLGDHHIEIAQTFLLDASTTIASIKIKFGVSLGSPTNGVTVRIETLDINNKPSGTLASPNLTKTDIPDENTWHTFAFDVPSVIDAGSYAIVLLIPEQSYDIHRTVRYKDEDPYSSGNMFERMDEGTWEIYLYLDVAFKVMCYGYGNLTGYWESPVLTMSAIVPMKFWILFYLAWIDSSIYSWDWLFQGSATKTWSEVMDSDDTWSRLFGATQPGTMHSVFYWSEDNVVWNETDGFELLSMEIEAKYIKFRIYLEDYAFGSRIMIDDVITLIGAFWQAP